MTSARPRPTKSFGDTDLCATGEVGDLARHSREQLGIHVANDIFAASDLTKSAHIARLTSNLRTALTGRSEIVEHLQALEFHITKLIRDALGDIPDAGRRAGLAASQVIGALYCRCNSKFEPITEMSSPELAAIVAPVLQYYLTADIERNAGAAF